MTRFADLPPAQQAGMLCNDERFRRFVGERCLGDGTPMSAEAAAEFVRRICKVRSRAALNREPEAARVWASLLTDFDAWRGRIAAPQPP